MLAYVEHCLPGRTEAERIELARRYGLALEVANRADTDLERLARSALPIVAVQAWGMHRAHPLHADPAVRQAAEAHLRETIERAQRLGAPRVVAVCGYGQTDCPDPLERCRGFFAALAPFARERGVRILIEPLSPRRASAMTEVQDIVRLHDALAAPEVFSTLLDTGHVLDAGHDPERYLAEWPLPVEELQLRGRDSARPPLGGAPARWIGALPRGPSVLSVEHGETIPLAAFSALIEHLRGLHR